MAVNAFNLHQLEKVVLKIISIRDLTVLKFLSMIMVFKIIMLSVLLKLA